MSTVTISGPGGEYEYPAPIKKPLDKGTPYYTPLLKEGRPDAIRKTWRGDEIDEHAMKVGVVHLRFMEAIDQGQAILCSLGEDT